MTSTLTVSVQVGCARRRSGPAPSTASDSARSGRGGARLDQTVKASASILPAVLATTFAAPQKKAASTTNRNGPTLAPASRSEPMTAMPAKAMAAPIACVRLGRSPRSAQAMRMVK